MLALYSAEGQKLDELFDQVARMLVAFGALLFMAQISPSWLRRGSPLIYALGLVLLILVLVTGDIGKGAQRWLDLGVRFQPSEIMKLGVPMTMCWLLHERPLPPSFGILVLVVTRHLPAGGHDRHPAGPGHGHPHRAVGRRGDLPGGPRLAVHRRHRGAGRRGHARALARHARLPAQAGPDAAGPGERPAGRGLPHHPVEDRDRLRAASSARAGSTAPRASWSSCRSGTPTSSLP